MKNYHMLFENLVLKPWGGVWQRTDPFKLGHADTFAHAGNELENVPYGHQTRFALSAAILQVAGRDGIYGKDMQNTLLELDKQVWSAETYGEMCDILDRLEIIFNKVDF